MQKDQPGKNTLANQSGQSLILALTIMFLLLFLGGIFVALIARNLVRAQRSGESLSAEYLAEVGIRYADHQLTYSEEGADWRPVPTFPKVVQAIANGQNPESLPPADKPNPLDPDYQWLIRGFSRFNYGKGRFLLLVTYEPKRGDPMSKYIKITSIGRSGIVDQNDPTTWTKQPSRLRSELVAYKAICITDYARFITNKDRRTGALPLGTPRFTTNFGELVNNNIHGAPIRVNGDLIWHGKNYVWLDASRGDVVEVAGDISHASPPSPSEPDVTAVYVNGVQAEESSSPTFNTSPDDPNAEIGKYRDGRLEPDVQKRPRHITRIEPPLIDALGTASRVTRYRELTRNSGEWKQTRQGEWYNTGYYGWGKGIYIANFRDVQTESEGYTLRANWTQPGTEYWNGPYYTPPAVTITLFPYDLDNADNDNKPETGPDIVITRDERTRYIWRDRDGNPLPATGEQIIMQYPENGVIFAEGNIRIKGVLPPKVQLTVVSGATIYIDGNILRNPAEPDESAIALLAEDYVCVNTTQFFGPAREVPLPNPGAEHFDVSPKSSFWFSFTFGADPARAYPNIPVRLYARHTAAPGGASYINLLLNYPPNQAEVNSNPYYSFYMFNPSANLVPLRYVYPLGDMILNPNTYWTQQYDEWECAAFPLEISYPGNKSPNYAIWGLPGKENYIGFQLDQSMPFGTGTQDYYLSRAFIQPLDIRIEALIYAQNKSFFIIPGPWMNPDPTDTEENFRRLGHRPPGTNPFWPFYGQPPDIRIIVYGSISENLPAPIGDSSAWMEKWGWIPPEHGTSGEFVDAYRPPLDPNQNGKTDKRAGLTFVYDDQLSYPYVAISPTQEIPVRCDEYGRVLPLLPKLPVSPQMLYMGEPT
ncbi:MAG: hypothetical protein K6T99_02090 [Armatimonadetes bacterium]|nr:hypothetical protein [Armatimonadota bacterium]